MVILFLGMEVAFLFRDGEASNSQKGYYSVRTIHCSRSIAIPLAMSGAATTDPLGSRITAGLSLRQLSRT